MEQRNRNGDRGRDRDDETGDGEAKENASEAATDLKTRDAPTRKPEPAAAPVATPSRGRGAVKRVLLLLAVCAAAALLYHYWGFWKGNQAAQTAPPPPAVTVAKPLIRDMQEWSDFTGQFEARRGRSRCARG